MTNFSIVPLSCSDFPPALPFVRDIIRAGDTYALPRDMPDAAITDYFFRPGHMVFAARSGGVVQGVYYLRANQEGGGAHVANAGFMVDPAARGQGIARAMARHAMETASAKGFLAMQFNFVISTNTAAVHLWQNLGFDIVGRIPAGFHHPSAGYVDALVMHRKLP